MKLKEIKEKEEFICNGIVFSFSLDGTKIKFTPLRRHDGKVKKEKAFTPPTKEEVMSYFFEKGYESFAGVKAWEYYNELEWHDKNGAKVKNWKTKMIQWFSEDIKRKPKQEDAKPQLIL